MLEFYRRNEAVILGTLSLASIGVFWQFVVDAGIVNPFFISTPVEVFHEASAQLVILGSQLSKSNQQLDSQKDQITNQTEVIENPSVNHQQKPLGYCANGLTANSNIQISNAILKIEVLPSFLDVIMK